MSTLTQDLRHERVGGMNRGIRPHQIPQDQWFTVFNMRPHNGRLEQVPLKKVLHYSTPYSNRTLLHLCNMPDSGGNSVVVGLSDKHVSVIRNAKSYKLRKNADVAVFNTDEGYARWGTEMWDNKLYFVNEQNSVHYTDGAQVFAVENAPRGRYCQIFFDHLVIGAPIVEGVQKPDSLIWSDLNNFKQFKPDSHTEADSYTFTDFQNGQNSFPGITGMLKLHNLLMIYSAVGVYQMQYSGHPRIVRVDPLFPDIGCGLRHSLIGVGNVHFFPDIIHKTFFALTPDSFEDIGGPIATYFMDTINPTMKLAQRTWAYFDPRYSEIVWVYVSGDSTGPFDRAVVFNVRTKQWYARSVEDLHSFCHYVEGGTVTCDELSVIADDLTGTCDDLAGVGRGFMQIWGSSNERILAEETATDPKETLVNQPWPYLETGDFAHESLATMKEVRRLLPQTTFVAPTKHMVIDVSARPWLNSPVVFTKVNEFDPATAEHGIANLNPKAAGRILRYRFMPFTDEIPELTDVMLVDQPSFNLRLEVAAPIAPGEGGITTEDDIPIITEDDIPIIPERPVTPAGPPVLTERDEQIITEVTKLPIETERTYIPPPPPPDPIPQPTWPIPEPWVGSQLTSNTVTRPWEPFGSGPVGLPEDGNNDPRVQLTAYPGCLDAWIADVWQQFIDANLTYVEARIVWTWDVYQQPSFVATTVYVPAPSYQQVVGIGWILNVEYR